MKIKPTYDLAFFVGILTILAVVTVAFAMPNSTAKGVIIVGLVLLGGFVELKIERASRKAASTVR